MFELNRRKYKELFEKAEEIKEGLGIETPVQLRKLKSKIMDGRAPSNKMVRLSTSLLKLYKTQNEYVLYFMLAHELAHVKNQDATKRKGWTSTLTLWSNKARALSLLKEMRANVEGMAVLGLSNEEIDKSQMLLQEFNKNPRGKASYKYGYPDRFQIADFTKRYKEFNNELVEELLADFCKVMNIKSEDFTEKVKKTFQEHWVMKK